MPWFLGLDTSNYTTSVAAWNSETGEMRMEKRPLPVQEGRLGLRQSDAVFSHVSGLGDLVEDTVGQIGNFIAVGASVRPRDIEGSYMPCFLVGKLVGESMALAREVPFYSFSHQGGHIAAAVFSTGKLELLEQPFVAFHLSGGTTECVLVTPQEKGIFTTQLLYESMDLYAGQAVDRVGAMLGLSFPAGPALEQLALQSKQNYKPRIPFREGNPSLSGVENQCKDMREQGNPPEDIAKYCLQWISRMVQKMTETVRTRYPEIPVVYAGGVLSNSIIRREVTDQYGGYFAEPRYSADNAAGIALLTGISYRRKEEGAAC